MLRAAVLRAARAPPAPARAAIAPLARRWASTTPSPYDAPPEPAHAHHSPAAVNPPLPPGVELDPQLHGYPQLPEVSLQTREPFGWWDQQERKNFEEVFHEEEDRLGMWGPDVHKISGGSALLQLIAAGVAIAGFTYFLGHLAPPLPAARREYPYNGLEKELGGHGHARVEEADLDE